MNASIRLRPSGRRRAFLIGLAGFAAASAVGGAAPTFGALLGVRAVQGACAALLTPTALSLLAVTFRQARERAKAFAVFGAIAGTGGALGQH
jgi:MFS family permease